MKSSRVLVVLPSYNERENIISLINTLLDQDSGIDVCVVDDSSPDGTSQLVEASLADWNQRVHLITRAVKDGRGGAVRAGFEWGLAQTCNYQAFIEMDCDFSHLPSAIVEGLGLLANGSDIALGSRYPRGKIIGWPLQRRIFSFFANLVARVLISWEVADYTNGFRFYSRKVVEKLLDYQQQNKGYIYLSEVLSTALRHGLRISEFPIVFKNRERGVSNTGFKEIFAAFTGIVKIAWHHHSSKPPAT